MKTLAAIKNELFNDYLKIVSTDNLETTLDNPAVPVPFVCVASVENNNAESLATELNTFFAHKKIKNKDFLAVEEEDLSQLKFLFNLIQLSSTGAGVSTVIQTVVETTELKETEVEAKPKAKRTEKTKEEPVVVEVTPEPVVVEVTPEPVVVEVTLEEIENPFDEPETSLSVEESDGEVEIIEALHIPKKSLITFAKDETITALIIDEKTVVYENVEMPIIEATKKAFKKAGATGLPLGLSNWNFNGDNLKSLKDKK